MEGYTGGSASAEHLCVLVHGLWGNPNHMASVAKSLRSQYPADQLYILNAKRNSGSFTYDGIELGGERLCVEIEEELQVIESKGGKIKKLSFVGYSLGGLVARYAVGVLYAKGILDQFECMNFTAFASPFLGVRNPRRGWANRSWNVLGPRILSESGRQLFTVDNFRDTGRPLLAILADPKSIFMSGLAKFKRRTLYSNIVNDRTAIYYTTSISKTDPYTNLAEVKVNYASGYEDVILDLVNPVSPHPSAPKPTLAAKARGWIANTPLILALTAVLPVAAVAFLAASLVQSARSSKRIRLHEKGLAGVNTAEYRVPLLIKELRSAVEDVYENLNSSQGQEYLRQPSGGEPDASGSTSSDENDSSAGDGEGVVKQEGAAKRSGDAKILARERRLSVAEQPTLALTPEQFSMIRSLDALGWRKYPVWIHKHSHSHAAIIVRSERSSFEEGRVVLKHWIKEEFLF